MTATTKANGATKGAPVSGAPVTVNIGGEASEGFEMPDEGLVIHGEVTESIVEQQAGKKPTWVYTVTGRDKKNPEWDGKKLFTKYQTMVANSADKQKGLNGILKRVVVALGGTWDDKKQVAFNPKFFVGRKAFFRISHEKNEQNGKVYGGYDRVGKTREECE